MPSFYFDTDDGDRFMKDKTGTELPSLADAAQEAAALLRDLAHHERCVGRRTLAAIVRDAGGSPVYRATMTVTGALIGARHATGSGVGAPISIGASKSEPDRDGKRPREPILDVGALGQRLGT